MKFCTKCGSEIPDGSKFCPNCGAPADTQQAPSASGASPAPAAQPAGQGTYMQETGNPGQNSSAGHGLAIGSLVCGIVGVVMWFTGYGSIISIILGIVGLVLAGNARKAGNAEGIRTAGFVLSIIALVGGCIVFIYLMIVLAMVGATYGAAMQWLQN